MIYYPAHYLGFEAIFSVLSIGVLKIPTGSSDPKPKYDLVARATSAIAKGTTLIAAGHHHEIPGLEGILLPAESISKNKQIPFYLCDGTTLKCDVKPGALITSEMLQTNGVPILWKLRKEQDEIFFKS